MLKQRIAGSPYVLSVLSSTITRTPGTRDVSYTAYVNTQFGVLIVSFTPPGAAAGTLP